MTSKMFPTENPKSQRWTEEDVLVMLCALNSNVEEIRAEFEADKRDGIAFAADRLSKTVGNGCNPARVRGKMEHLWKEGGPSGGRDMKPIDPLYRFGAWTRTLPSLDAIYPGMLKKIALAGNAQESIKRREETRPARVNGLRRREKDTNGDPIECKCGFNHFASACVHCKSCQTWQHIWCYYDSDSLDAAPDDHTCDRCTTSNLDTRSTTNEKYPSPNDDDSSEPSENLIRALERLQIQSHKNNTFMTRKGTRGANYATDGSRLRQDATSGIPDEEELLYGPQDEDVQSVVKTITSFIKTVAYSLDTDDFQFGIPSSKILGDSLGLVEVIQKSTFSNCENQTESSSTDNVPFLRMILGSAIWNWTFYSHSLVAPPDKIQSRYDVLFGTYYETLLSHHEIRILRNIHRKAWTTLTVDRPDVLKPIISKEADLLARRLLCLLSSIFRRSTDSGDTRPLETAEDWINSTRHGRWRFKLIVELFVSCIKLKDRLPLSGYFYEVFYPTSAESRFIEACPEELDGGIQFCYAPAILQYEPNIFQREESGMSSFFGEQNFVRATVAQRAESRVVCPAVVTFR